VVLSDWEMHYSNGLKMNRAIFRKMPELCAVCGTPLHSEAGGFRFDMDSSPYDVSVNTRSLAQLTHSSKSVKVTYSGRTKVRKPSGCDAQLILIRIFISAQTGFCRNRVRVLCLATGDLLTPTCRESAEDSDFRSSSPDKPTSTKVAERIA
jgi:hypothetical protein